MQGAANEPAKKRRRLTIISAIVLGGLLIAGVFIVRSRNSQAAEVRTGDTIAAFRGDLSASATASGQVEAVHSATLSVVQPGIVADVFVTAGTPVDAGAPLVQLAQRDLVLQVERMRQNVSLKEANLQALLDGPSDADVAAAEAAVKSAQASLDDLLGGPTAQQIAEYEANIRQQQAGIASASASYNSARDSISAATLAAAEADLVAAQIAYKQAEDRNEDVSDGITYQALLDALEELNIAQAKVDELRAGPKRGSLNSASADITAALANLSKSEADYDALLSGSTATQIMAAEASLSRAKSDLADLMAGASEPEVIIAEAELAQARLDLQAAEESLAEATLVAPFDGLVTEVLVSVGERATGAAVDIVSSALEVVLQVDELDIGSLKIGQPAQITLEALPNAELEGSIKSIAPSAGNTDSVVAYDVVIEFDAGDLPVLVGMTADAQLVTAEKEDILLVPNAALTPNRQAGTYAVNLVLGEEDGEPLTESREVVIGLRDRDYTEIISGLAEGDVVLIGELSAPTIDFGGG